MRFSLKRNIHKPGFNLLCCVVFLHLESQTISGLKEWIHGIEPIREHNENTERFWTNYRSCPIL